MDPTSKARVEDKVNSQSDTSQLGVNSHPNQSQLGLNSQSNHSQLGVNSQPNQNQLGVNSQSNHSQLGVNLQSNQSQLELNSQSKESQLGIKLEFSPSKLTTYSRLPSFKGPRDLTLASFKIPTAAQSKRKNYVPNIPIKKENDPLRLTYVYYSVEF